MTTVSIERDSAGVEPAWICVLSGPPGQVQFKCPDCRALFDIVTGGDVACSACSSGYYVRVDRRSLTYHSFAIRRATPA